jgi:NADH-quinone oxidoreductase subunit C
MSDEERPQSETSGDPVEAPKSARPEATAAEAAPATPATPSEPVASTKSDTPSDPAAPEAKDAAEKSAAQSADKSADKPAAPANASAAKAADADAPTAPAAAAPADGEAKPVVRPAPAAKATAAKPAAAAGAAKPAATAGAAAGEKKAPPKKEAPPPDPRTIAAKELAEHIRATVAASLGDDVVEEAGAAQYKPMLRIRKDRWVETIDLLRKHEAWRLNYIELMAGTDYKDYLEVVTFIQSTELGHFVLLKTRTDKENPEIPSIVGIHPGVNWEEREIYDLLGVKFTNHPDLRRIMLWEGFKGHPLRKDYTPWEGEEGPDVAE